MRYVVAVRSASVKRLEQRINSALEENKGRELINVKYDSVYDESNVIYSALLFFERTVA